MNESMSGNLGQGHPPAISWGHLVECTARRKVWRNLNLSKMSANTLDSAPPGREQDMPRREKDSPSRSGMWDISDAHSSRQVGPNLWP